MVERMVSAVSVEVLNNVIQFCILFQFTPPLSTEPSYIYKTYQIQGQNEQFFLHFQLAAITLTFVISFSLYSLFAYFVVTSTVVFGVVQHLSLLNSRWVSLFPRVSVFNHCQIKTPYYAEQCHVGFLKKRGRGGPTERQTHKERYGQIVGMAKDKGTCRGLQRSTKGTAWQLELTGHARKHKNQRTQAKTEQGLQVNAWSTKEKSQGI